KLVLLDAVGLVITPLIRRLHLLEQGLVGVVAAEQGADGGQRCQQRGAQCDRRHPPLAGMLGMMVDLLVYVLQRGFLFFHAATCWSPTPRPSMSVELPHACLLRGREVVGRFLRHLPRRGPLRPAL